jgi:hypothetical protein
VPTAVVVVDVANVVGSRPDGWWRDRAGASTRQLRRLATLTGRPVEVPGHDSPYKVTEVVAVIEGRARDAQDAGGVTVVRAAGSGDDEIARVAAERATTDQVEGGAVLVVVTADRGLRARLPPAAVAVGPRWLDDVLGEPG